MDYKTIAEFEANYKKKTRHRKQCSHCGKRIMDGERVMVSHMSKEENYPVKGRMAFTVWKFSHINCYNNEIERALKGTTNEG